MKYFEAENHFKRDDLTEMSKRAARQILEGNKEGDSDYDPYYEKYRKVGNQPDVLKLADTIRVTLTSKKMFHRTKKL